MTDSYRQIPGGAYHNDIDEVSTYQRLIPSFGIAKYINEVEVSSAVAPAVQMFVMFPVRMDGIGHGGIFPGGRSE
jgi:hypothetical protein